MDKKSLQYELVRNPRETEDSRMVVSKWESATDAYLPEIPDASNAQYFILTAERLLYRSKMLSLPIDQALSETNALQSAHPFGINGPTFSDLRNTSVRIAMAFIPLTLNGGNDRAMLARLYCAAGLSVMHKPPFADGVDAPGIDKYSWFVAGVPAVFEGKMISGRSWLLAANLLMRVVEKNDKATARNLVANFIVTGDVENGSIKEVEMGNKPDLANIKEYRNFKWIIPMKNGNEMNNIPSRKVEKPDTLEEAYRLIETMRNKATHSFFRFLKSFDLVGMQEQFEIGADIFAEDPETSLLPVEFIATAIDLAIDSNNGTMQYPVIARPIKMPEKLVGPYGMVFLPKAKRISEWLKCQGADCAKTVYVLAKAGLFDAIAELSMKYPIGVRDGSGCTAVDIALNNRDWETAKQLHERFGINCDTTASRNKLLKDAICAIDPDAGKTVEFSNNDFELIRHAMEVGLTPESQLLIVRRDEFLPIRKSFFAQAISGGNEKLVRLCLEHGADPNTKLVSTEFHVDKGEEWSNIRENYTPLELATRLSDTSSRDKIMMVLKEFGAQETQAVLTALNKLETAKLLDDGTKRHEVYLDALKKLNSNKDNEQNHSLIVECLRRGESMHEHVYAETWDEIGSHIGINSSLWGMAIYFGWCNIVEECLKIGVNPNDEIAYDRISWEGMNEGLWLKKSAVEVVKLNDYADGRVKSRLLSLLKGSN